MRKESLQDRVQWPYREMHGDKSTAGKVDETQVTKDSNSQLIYLDFFHELNEELLKVLS